MVAAQAVDLRKPERLGAGSSVVHAQVRQVVAMLEQDRPLGRDAERVAQALQSAQLDARLRTIAAAGMQGHVLAGLG